MSSRAVLQRVRPTLGFETAWFEAGGSAADLADRIAALSDYE